MVNICHWFQITWFCFESIFSLFFSYTFLDFCCNVSFFQGLSRCLLVVWFYKVLNHLGSRYWFICSLITLSLLSLFLLYGTTWLMEFFVFQWLFNRWVSFTKPCTLPWCKYAQWTFTLNVWLVITRSVVVRRRNFFFVSLCHRRRWA